MASADQLSAAPALASRTRAGRGIWLFSWPLLAGSAVYLYFLHRGRLLLQDGDTYWHIATGRWIWRNQAVPSSDPFSHTAPGTAWTAHEWLSDLILAGAHQLGGWHLLIVLTALAMAVTIALLLRELLQWLEPIYALLFAVLAEAMTAGHVLARPHMLALPVLMLWTIGIVRAREENRAPPLWLLPLMVLWANLHGGFTLGIALAFVFAVEASIAGRKQQRLGKTVRSWGLFLAGTIAAAMMTPQGVGGFLFTWQVMQQSTYALDHITEWRSPDFHHFNQLELWMLGGLALILHQGLRLPPIRLLLVVGLLHLALKHSRNIELLGLLTPLFLAVPFSEQWQQRTTGQAPHALDRFFLALAKPSGHGAFLLAVTVLAGASVLSSRAGEVQLPEDVAPLAALRAVQQSGVKGPVLNSYHTGGYLIYSGIPPFIDGRAEMYGDAFYKEYLEALNLVRTDGLEKLLDKYRIAWTLLQPESPAVTLLDHLPGWRRVYADKTAVVHVKVAN